MGLHYAPFELVHALYEVCVDGHPSAVFCADEGDLVSRTWALVALAFPRLEDYFSIVKFNIEAFYYPYGGSPLDELTKEDYETARDAYKPVIEYILRNFRTALLSCAAVDKTKRMFGGKKKFELLVKEFNILSLDSSYESETATALGISVSHLVERRRNHCGILTSDHPETLHHPRRPSLHQEQCRRYDAMLRKFVGMVTGDPNLEVTVGRDILQSGPTRGPSQATASHTERWILCALILAGSKTVPCSNEAKQMALRIQAKGARGTPLSRDQEQVLIGGTMALVGIDVSNDRGSGDHVVKRCTTSILSALTGKTNETRQTPWYDDDVDRVIDFERKLHGCRNRFAFIALAVPGKCRDRQKETNIEYSQLSSPWKARVLNSAGVNGNARCTSESSLWSNGSLPSPPTSIGSTTWSRAGSSADAPRITPSGRCTS